MAQMGDLSQSDGTCEDLHIFQEQTGEILYCLRSDGGGKEGKTLWPPQGALSISPQSAQADPSFQGAEAQHTQNGSHSPQGHSPADVWELKVSRGARAFVTGLLPERASFAPSRCCYCLESKWPSRGKALEMKLFLLHAV